MTDFDQRDSPSFRARLEHAFQHNDWGKRVRAVVKEKSDQLHRPEDKAAFLRWYSTSLSEVSTNDTVVPRNGAIDSRLGGFPGCTTSIPTMQAIRQSDGAQLPKRDRSVPDAKTRRLNVRFTTVRDSPSKASASPCQSRLSKMELWNYFQKRSRSYTIPIAMESSAAEALVNSLI